jgi:tetratricopeptide (TPR) repeat protein
MITNLTIFVMLLQTASINGQVRDAQTRQALAMVRIELLHQGIPNAMDYTDAEGRFNFVNVLPGSYTISATSLGYDSNAVEFDSTMPGPFEIELARTSKQAQHGSPVVSVREYMLPETARKEFDRAQREIKRQDCAKAIEHLENGLRLVEQASALNDLGNCYRKLGKFDSAEAAFRHAVELSDSVYIALNLAEVYTAQKRFKEAKAALDLALTRTPVNGDAYYGLALAYFSEERFEEAEAAALQAHIRPHRIADVHLLLAKIYARKNPARVAGQLELYLNEAPGGAQSDRVRQVLRVSKR